ncbi:MAG: class I SAM-dependent methyltransferase [Deltaproteobacteria bacterium]|nr:class I SAM-dependent methyltransferase [Deltaproteobacteria bacterium]
MSSSDYRTRFLSDTVARKYDEMYQGNSYDLWLWNKEMKILELIITKYLRNVTSIRYLDFACGIGRIVSFMESRVGTAVGIDVSLPMLERAAQRVRTASLVHGDITQDKNLLAGPFDLITAFRFFLNAQTDLRAGALEALRVRLADDGLLVLNIHGNSWSLRAISVVLKRLLGNNESINQMSPLQVKRMLVSHGFRVVDMYGVGVLTPRLHKLCGQRVSHVLSRMLQVLGLQVFAIDIIVVCRKMIPSEVKEQEKREHQSR